MDKTTAQRIVRDTFKAAFDKKRYRDFINELCNGFNESKAIASMGVPHAFSDHIKSCQRLGTFESPEGELADVLVVQLTESFKLERTRTALRDFVAHKLKRGEGEDNSYKEAALVAFVAPDSQSWRFSYVRMEYATRRDPKTGKIKPDERLTPARRYSYLVGTDEECHTAQSRFLALLQNTTVKPTLAQIEEAFSVESVTREFFGEYARLFADTEAALAAIVKSDQTLRDDFTAKGVSTVDFAKKLLGQIVFLYFIQKKGWLGVPKGGKWGDGQRNFLRLLADRAISEKKCLFNDVLEPLFYDTLATDRGHKAWCKTFACRIPFLNGGLFEPLAGYDWVKTNISFTNALFTNQELSAAGDTGTGILDVFDRYNFTVNEAEPLEKEVAIDPEMLGKVFENLIEENRRKGLGAFYTPREIVHYMCQESLINYLDTALNHPTAPIGAAAPQPEIQSPLFVDSSEKPKAKAAQEEFTEVRHRVLVDRKDLEEWIRQSDQFAHYAAAIAAGTKGDHYPKPPDAIRKFAREIDEYLRDITVCDPAIGSGAFPVGMMTEIVRARMALTPWFNDIAERTAYHFKRHAIHNSIYGVDIDPGAVEIAKLRLWLSLVVDEEDVQQIKPLPNLDYKIVVGNSLLGFPFKSPRIEKIEKLKAAYFDEAHHDKKQRLKYEIDEELSQAFASSRKSLGYEVTFDFGIYFSEVFRAKQGFDVVIANPPYVQIKAIPEQERRIYEKQYKFATGRFNLFYLFIERCEMLLRGNGYASFIIPDRLLLNTQCKEIREWLLNENNLCELVSFGDQVFEAVVDSILLMFQRQKRLTEHVSAKRKVAECDLQKIVPIKIPISYFELSPSSQFDLNYSVPKHALLQKITSRGICLGEISDTKDGIIQSKIGDELFLTQNKNADCRKLLVGRNVTRYQITYGKLWVDYRPDEMMRLEMAKKGGGLRLRDRSIFERNKILTRQTADEIIAAYDEENYYYANTLHGTSITNKNYHPHYILGVLNSKITTWFYRSSTDEGGKVFAQIKIEILRKLPIPKATPIEQKPLVTLVDRILATKLRDVDADTSALEREIDGLVYTLYGLTATERALVLAASA